MGLRGIVWNRNEREQRFIEVLFRGAARDEETPFFWIEPGLARGPFYQLATPPASAISSPIRTVLPVISSSWASVIPGIRNDSQAWLTSEQSASP